MDSNMSKNTNYIRAQAIVLVCLMIVAGSIAVAPAIFASESGDNNINDIGFFDLDPLSWADVTQSAPASCVPNQNVMVLRTELFSNGPDTMATFGVTYSGTDVTDVAVAEMLLDDGDGVFTEGSETSLGLGLLGPGDTFIWNPGLPLPPASTTFLWMRFQLGDAVVGNVIDAYVDAGQILLLAAGTTPQLDPAGISTVGSNLYAPHAIYGYVKDDAFNPLNGVAVTVTHLSLIHI